MHDGVSLRVCSSHTLMTSWLLATTTTESREGRAASSYCARKSKTIPEVVDLTSAQKLEEKDRGRARQHRKMSMCRPLEQLRGHWDALEWQFCQDRESTCGSALHPESTFMCLLVSSCHSVFMQKMERKSIPNNAWQGKDSLCHPLFWLNQALTESSSKLHYLIFIMENCV